MCGISGIFNFNNKAVCELEIKVMMEKMKHRGPDDEGLFIRNNFGLGFVRLSILDLSIAGHQPMYSQDKKLVIVFNGEIFNYKEIREELKHQYNFKTETDTEVILAAYQEWGEDCLDKFNGMFAIVIYDLEKGEIFGARDRYGIKPFYYYQDETRIVFASEINSIIPLLKHKEPNNKLIYDYLLFNRTDHTNNTFFKGIKKLQHGHKFRIHGNNFVVEKWYDLERRINTKKYLSPKEYRKLFQDSLKLRLRADVPFGVTLSGGIDSSSVVSSLTQDFGLNDLSTFSAVFGKDDSSDESEFINEFKGIVQNMHYISPTANDFFSEFENLIAIHNEPMPDTSPYAQYKVMEMASKFVKVTLDGQGADEQLAGYHYFFGSYYLELIKQLKFGRFISENLAYLKKHKKAEALKFLIYYMLPLGLQSSVQSKRYPSVKKQFIKKYKHDAINKMLYKPKSLNESLLQHFEYKLEHLLRYEDLNSMHFSIESRVPFLDYRLVEATLASPSNQKINSGETKHLLREAVKDILPKKIVDRKDKKGFTNPRDKWFKSEKFRVFILDLINSESFKSRGYFDSEIANAQYIKHLEGRVDISKEIWKWINLEVWFRKFID